MKNNNDNIEGQKKRQEALSAFERQTGRYAHTLRDFQDLARKYNIHIVQRNGTSHHQLVGPNGVKFGDSLGFSAPNPHARLNYQAECALLEAIRIVLEHEAEGQKPLLLGVFCDTLKLMGCPYKETESDIIFSAPHTNHKEPFPFKLMEVMEIKGAYINAVLAVLNIDHKDFHKYLQYIQRAQKPFDNNSRNLQKAIRTVQQEQRLNYAEPFPRYEKACVLEKHATNVKANREVRTEIAKRRQNQR